MKLILIRHGETIENENKILMGHMQGTLSLKGINQAKMIAKRLENEKIDIIYSSDLKRANDTAKEIAKYHKNIKLNISTQLREGDLGSLSGKKKKDVNWKKLPLDVENLDDFKNRVNKFLDNIFIKHQDENVLIVAHNGTLKMIHLILNNMKAKNIIKAPKYKNTSITIIELDKNKTHKIKLFNCIKHLN